MYVDAKLINGRIHVAHYDEHGKRKVTTHLPPYVFYYEDNGGPYQSIYHDPLKVERHTDRIKFSNALRRKEADGYAIFESDVHPVFRLLEERFPTEDTPPLKVAFLDIEADKDPDKGHAEIDNPYAIVTAVTVYNKWEDTYYTLAVAPPTLTRDEAIALLAEERDDGFGSMVEEDGYYICKNERELLEMMLYIIEDADVVTGWNSTFYDLPYLIQRIRLVLGRERFSKIIMEDGENRPFQPSQESRRWLELLNRPEFGCLPEMRMIERFGKKEKAFQIFGRVHLDYLELYRKFTFEELHSYSLDNILQREVDQTKVPYEGSLDQLYRYDFRTFIAYNRQDVAGLTAVDDKLKMIELANTMAHMAGVTMDKVFGSVAIIEQAILRELHRKGLICFNKAENALHETVPGAYVVEPHAGLYDWVAAYDINSLYPSVIRSLNISPECVVGQFIPERTDPVLKQYVDAGLTMSEAWRKLTGTLEYHAIMEESDELVTFVIEGSDDEITDTGKNWKERLKQQGWSLSANGTVFNLAEEGIVSFCLSKWYAQRVEWQKEAKSREGDEATYYDMIQLVMKIFLNSTYGAYLNRFFRFYDPRLGKSVTLTGRLITKHMIACADERIEARAKASKSHVIYGDTDSVYVSLAALKTPEMETQTIVDISDEIGEEINGSFPAFMDANCFVGEERGGIIIAGREIVGTRGLFKDVKKRYAIHVIDKEGKPKDELKIMGMEVRRSDTPKYIQEFLSDCIERVVKHGQGFDELVSVVEEFREVFDARQPWERGTPCRVSNLTVNSSKLAAYNKAQAEGIIGAKKPSPHYAVTAAFNTNELMESHEERRWDVIRDGDKVEVLYLLPNQYGLKSVAIKVEETYVPEWFQRLPFDNDRHEQKLIDKKLQNTIGDAMGWNFARINDYRDEVFEEVDFFE